MTTSLEAFLVSSKLFEHLFRCLTTIVKIREFDPSVLDVRQLSFKGKFFVSQVVIAHSYQDSQDLRFNIPHPYVFSQNVQDR